MKNNEEIKKVQVRAGKRTYFIDLKVASTGNHYVEITQSKRTGENEFKRNMIMVFEENFEDFMIGLDKIIRPIIGQKQEKTAKTFDEIRKTYSGAYRKWTDEDDEKLLRLHSEGKSTKELSEIFGRTNGAIRSRLNKLFDVSEDN